MDNKTQKKKFPIKDSLTLAAILLIGILGSLAIIYSTRWGPWVFSDSTAYIVSAKNLISGHGLGLYGPSGAFHPLTLHPPFYPLLLGFFGWIGADILTTARWLDITLFGLTIIIVGVSLYAYTKSSWLALGGSFLLFSMPALVDIYSGAMSEPLFIFTGFAGILLILLYVKNNRCILLVAAAVLTGMSLLTRYVGLAFIITGTIGLLFFSRLPWKKRVLPVMIYGLISCLPIIGWWLWINLRSPGSNTIQAGKNIWEQLTQFRLSVTEIIWSWLPYTSLLPDYSYNLARNLLVFFILLMVILFFLAARKLHKTDQHLFTDSNGLSYAVLMFIFTLAYLFVLGFSYIFRVPTPDLIVRTLLPAHIAILLGLLCLILFFIQTWSSHKWLVLFPIFLILGFSISYLHDTQDIISIYHQSGFGYTSRDWRNSETIRAIKQIPSNIPLISNESALVLFYTGRPAYDIAELMSDEPQDLTQHYGDDPTDPAQKAFREDNAALILFYSSFWQYQKLYGDQANLRLDYLTQDLSIANKFADGSVYYFPTGNR